MIVGYDFCLKFELNDLIDRDELVERLYESGCDDALIGTGREGKVGLDFIREAESAYAAISSAIADVKRVVPTATLIEAAPDLVSLTDVAEILGCSRQNARNLIVDSKSIAPLPVYDGTPSLWHLAEVLSWLKEKKNYAIDEATLEVAKITMGLNLARSWQKVDASISDRVKALVA
ncbi:prophage CP4-57 regulatory [Thalassoporum mexicanum PCC 7367]|uniref:helix-turn-helix transcriptional regulator n=1 Tax=Thalassoporum mexicanum TaxID=3457544 RepID=UPI00029FC872|nr:hypothetical protein [Pseudanabaena sp. PCC 7367]AFY71298.1 prophage CP4-57 regulatory [Pseudanabaena sp. PCC 7367]